MKFNIALAQTDCILGDERANLRKARDMVAQASSHGARLAIFPEMYLTGYALEEETTSHAQLPDSPWLSEVRALAMQNSIALAVGYPELDPRTQKVYNSVCLVDGDGAIRGTQRKIHLYGKEKKYFEAGESIETFDAPLASLGMMICYDLYFPENTRTLTLKNADLILVPSADWTPFDEFVDKFVPARAAENSVYIAYCNRVGDEKEFHFFGKSRLSDPRGNIVCQGTDREELLIAEVDPGLSSQVKAETGFLKDRRPQIYMR